MSIKKLRDANIDQKKVILRTDFNVPILDGAIEDSFRIDACLPTLKYLIDNNAVTFIVSHIGRPSGRDKSMSLKPIADYLEKKLNQNIYFFSSLDNALHEFEKLSPKDVAVIENIRFEAGETDGSSQLAEKIASIGDIFVNDAFAVSHREHTSVFLVPKLLPSYLGLLMDEEVKMLDRIRLSHKDHVVFIMGGSKVQSKVRIIAGLMDIIDKVCLGGVVANVLLEEQKYNIGNSYIDDENSLKEYLKTVSLPEQKILLPCDVVVSSDEEGKSGISIKMIKDVQEKDIILDIGPKTVQEYVKNIMHAQVIFWNGPMGKFEIEEFSEGTKAIIDAFYKTDAEVIVGGGDAISALDHYNARDAVAHICTGGGAMLKYLAEGSLPGIKALDS